MEISVLMPVYNAEKYVAEAIESTLKQSFQDFEFLIIDDGSTDNTLSIIRSYKDQRINVITNEHNLVQSLNLGLKEAKGKYIALVQNRPVAVYRDRNKDSVYDIEAATINTGVFGINLHHAGADSTEVNNWSAGCQVIARLRDFQQLMSIVSKQKASSYTYTLIKEEDL